jgi:hypothetical protein
MKRFINYIIQFIRSLVLRFALKLRSKMRMASMREAIVKADENKAKTGRRTDVLFDGNDYITIEKKRLKAIANRNKGKKHPIKHQQVKQVLKRSVYVAN